MADSMDKGFNDTELEDIMSEIENLEQEHVAEPKSAEAPEVTESEDVMEPVVAESHMAEVEAQHVEVKKENVLPINNSNGGKPCHSKMDFSISGDMQIQLSFTVAGQVVKLHVDEESGFKIEMDGGATFCLPLGEHKKAS